MLVENCPKFAEFLDGLVRRVSDFSFHLNSENNVKLSATWKGKDHPYLGNQEKFISSARQHVWSYYSNFIRKEVNNEKGDTWIYPFIEMGQLGIKNDSIATKQLIENAPAGAFVDISTGYFNLTQQYSHSIVQNSKATFNILMAHPKVRNDKY
jgi:CDP-diacylglycerol--glycerol-3-phosphate 3-phosphatidyltransferase